MHAERACGVFVPCSCSLLGRIEMMAAWSGITKIICVMPDAGVSEWGGYGG
jgi:hypothetical protein